MTFFINTAPGFTLNETLQELDIEDYLIYKESLDSAISEEDLNIKQKDVEIPTDIEEILTWVNNSEPTEASPIARQGFTPAPIVKQSKFALHLAARDGDIDKIKQLVDAGFDINLETNRSARPLHFAAITGKYEAAVLLMQLGADVHDQANGGNTALHFALKNHHYDLARALVMQGEADPLALNIKGKNPLSYLLNDLTREALSIEENQPLIKFEEMLDTLKVLFLNSEGSFVISDAYTTIGNELYFTPLPVVTDLLLIAASTPLKQVQKMLLDFAQYIDSVDSSHHTFILAKSLMQCFPTGGIYPLQLDNTDAYLRSEGHYAVFTTALASDSIGAYLAELSQGNEAGLKQDVFTAIHEIYQNAQKYKANSNQTDTFNEALDHYHQGDTVLLPSGWSGHFVDVILSKQQNLYVIANSGDRYQGELTMVEGKIKYEPGDTPGLHFYPLQEPERIDADFIQTTLNSQSKGNLEFEQPLNYGIVEHLFEIVNPDQEYGNCSWESHRDAVEGIALIELLNRDVALEEAKGLAKEYFEEWDSFHGHYMIDQYMSNDPGLSIEPLFDILGKLYIKSHPEAAKALAAKQGEEVISYTEEQMAKHHSHAQKIVDIMQSEKYMAEFKQVLAEISVDDPEFVNALKNEYYVDVPSLITQALPESAASVDVQLEVVEAYQPVTHFNIAHQMMVEKCLIIEPVVI